MAQVGETLHGEMNLQKVDSKMTFVWPLNERRYATKRTS